MAYITDVIVISGDKESIRPEGSAAGYCKIPVDLNLGAYGQYIFVCYNRGDDINEAITNLKVKTRTNKCGLRPCLLCCALSSVFVSVTLPYSIQC